MRDLLKSSWTLTGVVKALRLLPADFRRIQWRLARNGPIRDYLQAHTVRKLQIGCGRNLLPGWLNTDIFCAAPGAVYLDGTKPFPLPDASFDYVFSEHIIEHVPYLDGQKLLRECHRILKPGGRIRISTPNLLNIISLAAPGQEEAKQSYIKWSVDTHISRIGVHLPGVVINNFFWDFLHYFVYDPATLRHALESAGFKDVKVCPPGKSDDPNLNGIECHGKIIGEEYNLFETMVLEAGRP
ncbi:MAG: methyltransferase domain-containing protein [Verrucomicrobia bacterium]|nr:methyltransferase domain-containing protein [Verrucomicrobiota bacterium]